MNKSKAIGTAGETAVVRYLRGHGWPNAERRALHGSLDQGDVTGTPCLCWEVKAGAVARTAAPGSVDQWLSETEAERFNSGADLGMLVLARPGYGAPRAHLWWTVVPAIAFLEPMQSIKKYDVPGELWMTLETAVRWLRWMGYGDPL